MVRIPMLRAGAALVAALVAVPLVGQASQPARTKAPSPWVGSWATALTAAEPGETARSRQGFDDQTVRMVVHLSLGGSQVRVRLSNVEGEQTLTVGHATVAKPNTSTPRRWDVDPATVRDLSFGGAATASILKGSELYSDPVDLAVDDDADLVVSLYFPAPTGPTSWHAQSGQNNVFGPGDLSANEFAGYTTGLNCCWFFLSGIDVLRPTAAGAVVVLGDSTGEGIGSTLNASERWPDHLARRLRSALPKASPSVLNTSLAGNRLLHEGIEPGAGGFPGFVQLGDNAGARLDEDVFGETGVRAVIVNLGLDDLVFNNDSAADLIAALRSLATQIRARDLEVVGATITPYEGFAVTPGSPAGEWTPEKEATRIAVNDFIRTSPVFDGVADFDLAVRDAANPSRLDPRYDSGDHRSVNDAGNAVLASAVPLPAGKS